MESMMMASPASIEEQFRNFSPLARPSLWSLIITLLIPLLILLLTGMRVAQEMRKEIKDTA